MEYTTSKRSYCRVSICDPKTQLYGLCGKVAPWEVTFSSGERHRMCETHAVESAIGERVDMQLVDW